MASSDAIQVSSLPLPPMQYVNQYTDEAIRRGRAPKPPPPIQDTYHMFGNAFNTEENIIRPLESQGIKRLYPLHFDRRRELKKLNQSLLANFLDLLDLLVKCPDSQRRAEKVEDLSLLFIHIHHLLNEFRPHQARETLRVMMELQKRQRIETANRFQKHLDKVMDILQQAIQNLPEPMDLDSKIMIDTDLLMNRENKDNSENNQDPCYILDRVMCSIVDNMQ
ncbi:mediator of RNA polymerase II transcription subunit 7 [Diorhabda carinulata]|uniref:mediator of RNA polymerase II transcription subunit 7 n=1 Tax=Diorhabda sublineata TaxID=1163346 RepID=UPI0024E11BE3|nr:mediator of RNA polymerase II transcription subunit 7 [Diorhabda sublineata]XP_057672549.1 mediator of RNA polymerase II transcription subunit 7 [Diorhabda carinulata]